VVQLEALLDAAQDRERVLELGGSTSTGWKRRSSAASFSMCLRYSSSVVAPRQCNSPRASIGFKEVARVHRAFGLAGAHDEVELVDEQQDAPSLCLISASTALRRSSNSPRYFAPATKRAHVEREDRLVLQPLGHVAAQNALGEALDNGGLANAGFADQDGIVLGLAGEDRMVRRISSSRPMTGSIRPLRACATRSIP